MICAIGHTKKWHIAARCASHETQSYSYLSDESEITYSERLTIVLVSSDNRLDLFYQDLSS